MRFSAIAYTNGNGVMGDGNTQTIEVLPPGRIGPNKRYKLQVAIDGKNFIDSPYVYMTLDTEMVKDLYDYHDSSKEQLKIAQVKYIDQKTKKEIAKTEEIKCYSYFKTWELLSEAKEIPGYKLVKKPDMEKTYAEQPIVYYEYEKLSSETETPTEPETPVEKLTVEVKAAKAEEGKEVNVSDVVVPSKEGSTITCAEVNGLKIDANGSLVGTPKDVVFESGKKEATVKLEVVVENNGQKVTKEVSVTVNKKAEAETPTEPETPVEKLTVEVKAANAEEGKAVNIPNVVVPSKEGSKITCAEVNGLKIDANGSLVGTPKDIVFESGKKEAAVKLNVTVKNGDETVSKEVTVTVSKKEEATTNTSTSRPSKSSKSKKKNETPAVVTEEKEYKIGDLVVSSDIESTKPLVRVAGKDRTETSVEVSKSIYKKGADVVVISNKDKSSDSISATPYANLLKAPILYSNSSSAPSSIVNEIKRLKAKKIVIVGGDQSITKSQEEQLKAMGIEIDRISGKDRYETSSIIADRMIKLSGTADNVVIANGNSQVDAVSIAPIAVKQTSPILLTNGNKLSTETDKIVSNSKNIILAGGSQSISANLEKYVRSKSSKNVDRISGKDRYETAAAIAKKFSGNSDICIYANGTKIEDALVSAQLSGYKNAPIILVNNKNMSDSAMDYLKNNKIKKNIFVGGGNSISDETIRTVDGLVKNNK